MTLVGHKGVGEGGAIGAPAAIFDAVAPFGVRVTKQPLTPDRILDSIDAAETTRRRPAGTPADD